MWSAPGPPLCHDGRARTAEHGRRGGQRRGGVQRCGELGGGGRRGNTVGLGVLHGFEGGKLVPNCDDNSN